MVAVEICSPTIPECFQTLFALCNTELKARVFYLLLLLYTIIFISGIQKNRKTD